MCDDIKQPRFLCRYHSSIMGDADDIPLDVWMEANIPEDYRVVSILMDKMITNEITFIYTIVAELKNG